MSADTVFDLVDERGWRRGLGNLMKGQFSGWFQSSKWWRHALIWLAVINLILLFATIGMSGEAENEAGDSPLMLYGVFGGMFVAIGVMIIMQAVIVGEKKSGTAAWVMSKPVTRTSFLVSRLIGSTVGILLTAVLLPGLIAYITVSVFGTEGWLSPLNFLAGVAVLAVSAFFWLTLTLMSGTFFDSVAGVIAIPMVTFFAMWFLPMYITPLIHVSPVILFVGPGDDLSVSLSLFNGEAPFSWIPLIASILFSIVFIAVAIWRFNRQEFKVRRVSA
jgi:ABC-2 type transport system permease protein